jgi:thiol:disulfide interchange protein
MPKSSEAYRPLWFVGAVLVVWAAVVGYRALNPAKELVQWGTDLTAGRQQAITTGKPLLLYFTADWCGPCQQMKRTTFADQQVAQAMASVVPVKLDLDRNQQLAGQLQVETIPRFFMMTGDGRVISVNAEGYQEREQFLAWLSQASARAATAATTRPTTERAH